MESMYYNSSPWIDQKASLTLQWMWSDRSTFFAVIASWKDQKWRQHFIPNMCIYIIHILRCHVRRYLRWQQCKNYSDLIASNCRCIIIVYVFSRWQTIFFKPPFHSGRQIKSFKAPPSHPVIDTWLCVSMVSSLYNMTCPV